MHKYILFYHKLYRKTEMETEEIKGSLIEENDIIKEMTNKMKMTDKNEKTGGNDERRRYTISHNYKKYS